MIKISQLFFFFGGGGGGERLEQYNAKDLKSHKSKILYRVSIFIFFYFFLKELII